VVIVGVFFFSRGGERGREGCAQGTGCIRMEGGVIHP